MTVGFSRLLFVTLSASVLFLSAIAAASLLLEVDLHTLTRDPAVTAGYNPLTGLVSNLGAFLWCAAASTCLVAALIVGRQDSREEFWFFLAAAALSGFLLFDDFFQFHDYLAPTLFGFDEKVVVPLLGLYLGIYLFRFRNLILQTNFVILATALGFFAASILVDQLAPRLTWMGHWRIFLEDGAKWIGIACWYSYFTHSAWQIVSNSIRGRIAARTAHQRQAAPSRISVVGRNSAGAEMPRAARKAH